MTTAIIGLGNPSKKYEGTRHNVGFEVIDKLAGEYAIKVTKLKCRALIGEGVAEGNKILLVKPQTFMNLSGESVLEIIKYFKLTQEQIIVVYDDISLPVGKIRIRDKGSDGGHNGIKNILFHLDSDSFRRIKVGVGDKPQDYDLADYVLSRFSKDEKIIIDKSIEASAKAAVFLMSNSVQDAANKYN